MKLLKKTKKYLHVRLSPEELSLLEKAIKKDVMKELQEWIKNHDKLDEKRQLEEVRKNALAKLSEEERKALGL